MASSINASTAGGGGVIVTSDASGNLNIQRGGSTVVAVTSAGATVTGTLAISTPLAILQGGSGFTTGVPNRLLQNLNLTTGAVATGTTLIPSDDTIPQITEGDQYMSLAITPTSAASILEITVQGVFEMGTADRNQTMALFRDAVADALAAVTPYRNVSRDRNIMGLTHWMIAGTTSAITFRVRSGANASGTNTFNGSGGARLMGGVMNSFITIKEYAA